VSAATQAGARFEANCRRCPRLARHLDAVRAAHPAYHCRPVAPFGSARHRLLVVGLAPGLHGANRTGRPFTGDHAGILLYQTLHGQGFASAAESVGRGDGLRLADCRITNAVKCLPPGNKPQADEVRRCNPYLAAELRCLPADAVVIALGAIAHGAVLRAAGVRPSRFRFSHGAEHRLPGGLRLLDSYHCSRLNTNTGRLSAAMFGRVFARARHLIGT
jgi:uracil-DNA glycosylase family 4